MGLLMIEQPLTYNDIVDHSILQKQLKTPICLDESINSYHTAEQAINIGACKIINIKPQRVGGYWQAKLVSELAARNNIPVWCGGMIESVGVNYSIVIFLLSLILNMQMTFV